MMTIDDYVEIICNQGCTFVTQVISRMEQGEPIEELADLDNATEKAILEELKSIMQVFDNSPS